MVMGKLGAFLSKDVGALVKDAGKVLNTDLGTIAKGAGRVLKSDLGDLMRDAPATEKPVAEVIPVPIDKAAVPAPAPAAPAAATPAFDPDVTQKMDSVHTGASAPTAVVANRVPIAPAFDPDVTQKMDRTPPGVVSFDPDVTQKMDSAPPATTPAASAKSGDAAAGELANYFEDLLLRTKRVAPAGNEVKVLLPYAVGDFERPRAMPSGELTNDPVNAVYSVRGESVQVQLALCWDADEARERVDEMIAKVGAAAHIAPDRSWMFGPQSQQSQGIVCAWTRDCYYFCASSPKGAPALARFLAAYPY